MKPSYTQAFTPQEIEKHDRLSHALNADQRVQVEAISLARNRWQLTIVGFDAQGDLTLICGLLLVYGFDIVQGQAFAAIQGAGHGNHDGDAPRPDSMEPGRFVNVFTVRSLKLDTTTEIWQQYQVDLQELKRCLETEGPQEVQGRLVKRVAAALQPRPDSRPTLYPVDIEIDNTLTPDTSLLRIHAHDTIGFLYELCNALSLSGINITHLTVASSRHRVFDTLHVTDRSGAKITDPEKQNELRAAVVLIKHFTHLLPRSPNPERALLRFPDFLQHVFSQDNWVDDLASLEQSDVLSSLTHLLGVSDFLWEDFLRLQHANLFPIVTDTESLRRRRSSLELQQELQQTLDACHDYDEQRSALNIFKDREMFRTDMRHITGQIGEFGEF
ncbi:MAG: ACT domain-containing protein, partial [Planctomycetaceae bacterium]